MSVNWLDLVRSACDLDTCAHLFTSYLFALYDSCFPKRTVRFRSSDPPWIKPSLKILIDDRDRAHASGCMSKYLRLRQEVIDHTKVLKKRYLSSAMSTGSSRVYWKSVKHLGHFNRPTPSKYDVNVLNDYFCSNFQDIADNFDVSSADLPSSPLRISETEVCILLQKLKNKSPGPDGIPAWLLRDFSEALSPAISFLFNWSLSSSCVPACFKFANVTPVPKCSSPSVPSGFRPISLLSILSKVLERYVVQHWMRPILSLKCHPSQFAYLSRTGGGTTSALTLLQHEMLKFLDSSSGAVRIYRWTLLRPLIKFFMLVY